MIHEYECGQCTLPCDSEWVFYMWFIRKNNCFIRCSPYLWLELIFTLFKIEIQLLYQHSDFFQHRHQRKVRNCFIHKHDTVLSSRQAHWLVFCKAAWCAFCKAAGECCVLEEIFWVTRIESGDNVHRGLRILGSVELTNIAGGWWCFNRNRLCCLRVPEFTWGQTGELPPHLMDNPISRHGSASP